MTGQTTEGNAASAIARRSLRGSLYSVASSAITLSLGFARSLLLARWLAPEQFGVMTLALFFTDLLNRFRDLGYDQDLLRDKAPSDVKVSTHFVLQITSSVGMLLVCLALIPAWQHSYPDRPLLVPVILVLAAGRVVAALGGTPVIMLRKELGFGRAAGIDLVKAFIKTGGVLALAWLGAGVWALVAEDLLETLVLVVAIWWVHPVRLKWCWDREVIRGYLSFGLPLFVAQLIAFLLMQFDDFWVGTVLGDASLGFYAIAYGFAEYPRRVVSDPIQQVILATLAKVQDDRLRLSQAFYRSSAYLVRVGVWAGGVFALVAPEFVRTFIGDKWLPAVSAFRLLVVFAMSLPLVAVAINLLVATGESRQILRVRSAQLAVFVPLVILGVRAWGILGAALAEDVMVLVGLIVLLRRVRQHVDFSLGKLLACPMLGMAVGMGLVWGVVPKLGVQSDLGLMAVKGMLATLGYAATLLLLERRECRLALAWGLRALRHGEQG